MASTKGVRGDIQAIILAIPGNCERGIKIPLINTSGNFTKLIMIIILEVISVGSAEIATPTKDPAIDINISPKKNSKKMPMLVKVIPMLNPRIIETIIVIRRENIVDAVIIPNNITVIDNGAEICRSRPFSLVSHGIITGLIAVDVKKTAIEVIPTNKLISEIFLPITHVIAIKKGNSNPKIRTGPFLKYSVKFFWHNVQICPILNSIEPGSIFFSIFDLRRI